MLFLSLPRGVLLIEEERMMVWYAVCNHAFHNR